MAVKPSVVSAGAALDLAGAEKLSIKYLREKGRSDTTVKARELPTPGAYEFNPEGWATFCVVESVPLRVVGDEHVAVSLTTGYSAVVTHCP